MAPRSPMKKFRQLLQEQQEPFELEDYLFEREYSRKGLNWGGDFACSGGKLDSIKKFGKGFMEFNKILRISWKKLVSIHRKQKTKDLGNNGGIFNVGCKRVAESEILSPACSPKMFGSSYGNNNEETSSSTRRHQASSSTSDTSEAPEPCNLKVMQAIFNGNFKSEFHGPSNSFTIPEEILFPFELTTQNRVRQAKSSYAEAWNRDMKTGKRSLIGARPKDNQLRNDITLKKKVPEDSILSATLWELLLYSAATEKASSTGAAELQELVTSNPSSQLLISKRVIHQTKQLLFDCVREVVEAHSNSKPATHLRSQEATGEEANLLNLLNSDYLDSVAQWRDLNLQKQLIGAEIGEIILKEIINEVVSELIDKL